MTGIELERISIKTPCPKSWDEMQGDARTRFCDACSLHVHNLSALTRGEGESLLRARALGGRLCVTYARRADGTIVTADAPAAPPRKAPPHRPWTRRLLQAAASLAGALPFLSALAGAAAFAGCRPAAADPDAQPAPADPGIPVAPPAPADPTHPMLTGEIALPVPLLQLRGAEAPPAAELGRVAVEQGDVALPDEPRE